MLGCLLWTGGLVGQGLDHHGYLTTPLPKLTGAPLMAMREMVKVINPGMAIGDSHLPTMASRTLGPGYLELIRLFSLPLSLGNESVNGLLSSFCGLYVVNQERFSFLLGETDETTDK
jgi:hypothetical protein